MDSARVVFLQESTEKYPNRGLIRIVDERGNILGDSLPHTWFSAEVSPGVHEFFGWETKRGDGGGCACFLRQCYFVAAMRASLLPGHTYYISVGVEDGSSGEFISVEHLDFLRLSPDIDSWPPSLVSRLRSTATNVGLATDLSREHDASSFLCVGRRRMREAIYWDATTSTLLPSDGATAPVERL